MKFNNNLQKGGAKPIKRGLSRKPIKGLKKKSDDSEQDNKPEKVGKITMYHERKTGVIPTIIKKAPVEKYDPFKHLKRTDVHYVGTTTKDSERSFILRGQCVLVYETDNYTYLEITTMDGRRDYILRNYVQRMTFTN